MKRATYLLPLLFVSAAACAGDDGAPPLISDPPEPAIELGRISASQFESYVEGDKVTVMTQLQAGMWLMPTVRFTGMVGKPDISCIVIDMDKDHILAEANTFVVSEDMGDGWETISPFRMEVKLPDEEMSDFQELPLFVGDTASFECTAVDEEGTIRTVSHNMVVAEQ